MKQNKIFKTKEGDAWFSRNASYLRSIEGDLPLEIIAEERLCPKRVLEVGAANGFRLAVLREKYGSISMALEPSEKAIAEGKKLFPGVRFTRGTAEKLPFRDSSFDLVIINFVFHWIDREDLLRVVSELDRVLADKGFLLIGDFYPDKPGKFPYKHLPGKVFTFTQKYPALFTASRLYRLVKMVTADQVTKKKSRRVRPDRRIAFCLLRKDIHGNYEARTL